MSELDTALVIAPPESYTTDVWDGKFRYGALSTLISGHTLFSRYGPVMTLLQKPQENAPAIDDALPRIIADYQSLTQQQFEDICRAAWRNGVTDSVFDEPREFCWSFAQNTAFIDKMASHPELKPVDNYYEAADPSLLQLNVHRGLYHEAYGIPPNSVAAVFNAYLAGIRSVEIDVRETRDFVSVVLQDRVTNRLDASYDAPAKYVALWNASDVVDTPMNILDPRGDNPAAEVTPVRSLATTRDMLWAVRRWMPEITLYANTHGMAAVSLLKLLYDEPALRRNLVVKVRSELGGGVYDILTQYATRYTAGDKNEAKRQISSVNANFHLVIERPQDAVERAIVIETLNTGAQFRYYQRTTTGEAWTTALAYSRDSKLKPKDAPSYNEPWGSPLFGHYDLDRIEAHSYLAARWAMDFSAIGKVRILDLGLLPSLMTLIDANDRAAVEAMPVETRLTAAILTNIYALFMATMRADFNVPVSTPSGALADLKTLWHPVVFGGADRYPDFAFAQRNADGTVDQATLQDFYYSEDGLAYQRDDYDAKLTRSTESVHNALLGWPHDFTPGDRSGYVASDLPTDLRTMQMQLSGTQGFPQWMRYRGAGMIKQEYNPPAGGKFTLKPWSTRLFGKLRRDFPQFGADYNNLVQRTADLNKWKAALDSLESFWVAPEYCVNPDTVYWTDDVIWVGEIERETYDLAKSYILEFLNPLEQEVPVLLKAFAEKYGVNFDGTPVTTA